MPTEELFGAYHFLNSDDGAKADSFAFKEDDDAVAHIETYEVKWGTRMSTEGSAHGAADGGGLRSDGDLVQGGAGVQGAQDGLIDVNAPSWKMTTASDPGGDFIL